MPVPDGLTDRLTSEITELELTRESYYDALVGLNRLISQNVIAIERIDTRISEIRVKLTAELNQAAKDKRGE